MGHSSKIQLICPAGSLPALKAAVDNGADGVYMGFKSATNARNFPGLNFNVEQAKSGIEYAHKAGCWVLLAINTYPNYQLWQEAINIIHLAAENGFDAIIIADAGLLGYAAKYYPALRLHLSVQGSATTYEAINLYKKEFDIQRVVLPRVLSIKQVRNIIEHCNVEVEVFGFGSLCVMVEGRCYLSSYVTGSSPNCAGVCSPAKAVTWHEKNNSRKTRLNGILIDEYQQDEAAAYPTLCKGRFKVRDKIGYALEQPTSLNVLDILPELVEIGVKAIKVEGRQRSPAYVAQVTRLYRHSIDQCMLDPKNYAPDLGVLSKLDEISEGSRHTLGAYDRPWQ